MLTSVQPPAVDDNLCDVPDYLYLESGVSDGDGNPNDYVEVYYFEEDCFVSGEANSGQGSPYEKRSLDLLGNMSDYESLEKRGGSRLQQVSWLCGVSAKIRPLMYFYFRSAGMDQDP